jgi:uncharacterized delta-60 repeat protein
MSSSVKVGGVYKNAAPYVKVAGTWKFAPEAWSKVSGTWKKWFLAGGLNDSEFNIVDTFTGPAAAVRSVALQSDGKIVVVGLWNTFNGRTPNAIARMNADASVDTVFRDNAGTGITGGAAQPNVVAMQSDGKIIVGGSFTTYDGVLGVGSIVRINSDGTRDTAFSTNVGTAFGSVQVHAIAVQPDGKIILGGAFTTFNGATANRILRLNSDGTRDTVFTTNTGTGASGQIFFIAIQPDGGIILGGDCATFNGATVNRILRLNSDGTRDTVFTGNIGTGSTAVISNAALQPDGKIILGGPFTTFNGATANRILRLNSDGTTDTVFTTNTGTGASAAPTEIAIQPDGKIILGGDFITFNSVTVNRIVRLNSDGTRDTAFSTNTGTAANAAINDIRIQSDGKIVLGGGFSTFKNINVRSIVRLNSDGSISDIIVNGAPQTVNAVAAQSDGKIVFGGQFSVFNNVTVNGIARLNLDGTIDSAFTANTGTGASSIFVFALAIQSDGKIVLGGVFTSFNGATVNRIVRLNSDGTRDTTFTTNAGTGASGTVNAIAIQSDGKIILGGAFATFNGVTVNRIVRLNSDGTRDTTFTTNTGVGTTTGNISAIAIQSDGKIVLGGTFTTWNGATSIGRIVRLNSDGTRDTTFTTNNGTGAGNNINAIAVQSDGKIVLGGGFTTFNGVTINRIARLNSDGILDSTFTTNIGTGLSFNINAIAIQSDDKIIFGTLGSGGVITFNGSTVSTIVRLNSDGTRDTSFTANSGTGPNFTIDCIAIQPGNKIVIGGQFTVYNSMPRNRLAQIGGDLAA